MIIGTGNLEGKGGHVLEGNFSISSTKDGIVFETGDGFFFDGSPAPGWALGKNDIFTHRAALAGEFLRIPDEMQEGDGSIRFVQRGVIPEHLDVRAFDSVFLWCFEFPFLLGLGKISFGLTDS